MADPRVHWEKTDGTSSAAPGRNNNDGKKQRDEKAAAESMHHDGNFGRYMQLKVTKLREQFVAQQLQNVAAKSDIFRGVSIHVNGFTRPSHAELKQLMALHGGRFENYLYRDSVTHIICSNLPDTKIKQLAHERKPIPIVRPEWVVASINAGHLLPISDFQLEPLAAAHPNQRRLYDFKRHAAPQLPPEELYPVLQQQQQQQQGAGQGQQPQGHSSSDAAAADDQEKEEAEGRPAKRLRRGADERSGAGDGGGEGEGEGWNLQSQPRQPQDRQQQQQQQQQLLQSGHYGVEKAVGGLEREEDEEDEESQEEEEEGLFEEPEGGQQWRQQQQLLLTKRGSVYGGATPQPGGFGTGPGPPAADCRAFDVPGRPPHPGGSRTPSPRPDLDLDRDMGAAAEPQQAAAAAAARSMPPPPPQGPGAGPAAPVPGPSGPAPGSPQAAQALAAGLRAASDAARGPPRSTRTDPRFMETFFRASRLHFIGTWKTRIEALMAEVEAAAPNPAPYAKGTERVVMHVDMDCFFASVAAVGRPDLTGKPLAVCHSNSAKGTGEVSSANYLARSFGVRADMFIAEAKRRCPELVVMPYEFDKYQKISEQVYRILMSYTSVVQPVSCDEAFLDVTGLGPDPEQLAARLRADIAAATQCTASAGIGPNMLLAKLATRRAKPNGQFRVTRGSALEFLGDLNVDELPGVGWSLASKLADVGIVRVRQVWSSSRTALQKQLGAKLGTDLWQHAHGQDDRRVEPPKARKSVGAEVNYGIRFEADAAGQAEAERFVGDLAGEVAARLKTAGVRGRSLVLKVKRRQAGAPEPAKFMGHGACDNISRSVTLSRFTDDPADLRREAVGLLRALAIPPQELRGLGITVAKLDNDPASHTTRPSAPAPAKMQARPRTAFDASKPPPWTIYFKRKDQQQQQQPAEQQPSAACPTDDLTTPSKPRPAPSAGPASASAAAPPGSPAGAADAGARRLSPGPSGAVAAAAGATARSPSPAAAVVDVPSWYASMYNEWSPVSVWDQQRQRVRQHPQHPQQQHPQQGHPQQQHPQQQHPQQQHPQHPQQGQLGRQRSSGSAAATAAAALPAASRSLSPVAAGAGGGTPAAADGAGGLPGEAGLLPQARNAAAPEAAAAGAGAGAAAASGGRNRLRPRLHPVFAALLSQPATAASGARGGGGEAGAEAESEQREQAPVGAAATRTAAAAAGAPQTRVGQQKQPRAGAAAAVAPPLATDTAGAAVQEQQPQQPRAARSASAAAETEQTAPGGRSAAAHPLPLPPAPRPAASGTHRGGSVFAVPASAPRAAPRAAAPATSTASAGAGLSAASGGAARGCVESIDLSIDLVDDDDDDACIGGGGGGGQGDPDDVELLEAGGDTADAVAALPRAGTAAMVAAAAARPALSESTTMGGPAVSTSAAASGSAAARWPAAFMRPAAGAAARAGAGGGGGSGRGRGGRGRGAAGGSSGGPSGGGPSGGRGRSGAGAGGGTGPRGQGGLTAAGAAVTAAQIDRSVLAELPPDVQREIEREYGLLAAAPARHPAPVPGPARPAKRARAAAAPPHGAPPQDTRQAPAAGRVASEGRAAASGAGGSGCGDGLAKREAAVEQEYQAHPAGVDAVGAGPSRPRAPAAPPAVATAVQAAAAMPTSMADVDLAVLDELPAELRSEITAALGGGRSAGPVAATAAAGTAGPSDSSAAVQHRLQPPPPSRSLQQPHGRTAVAAVAPAPQHLPAAPPVGAGLAAMPSAAALAPEDTRTSGSPDVQEVMAVAAMPEGAGPQQRLATAAAHMFGGNAVASAADVRRAFLSAVRSACNPASFAAGRGSGPSSGGDHGSGDGGEEGDDGAAGLSRSRCERRPAGGWEGGGLQSGAEGSDGDARHEAGGDGGAERRLQVTFMSLALWLVGQDHDLEAVAVLLRQVLRMVGPGPGPASVGTVNAPRHQRVWAQAQRTVQAVQDHVLHKYGFLLKL